LKGRVFVFLSFFNIVLYSVTWSFYQSPLRHGVEVHHLFYSKIPCMWAIVSSIVANSMSKVMKPCKACINLFPRMKYWYDVCLHAAENFHFTAVKNLLWNFFIVTCTRL
jgi:hypothetical protein